MESLCKQLKISTFNMLTLGLFLGFLLGQVIVLLIDTLIPANLATEYATGLGALKVCICMLSSYIGMVTTLRSADELAKFIPVKTQTKHQAKQNASLLISQPFMTHESLTSTSGIVDTP